MGPIPLPMSNTSEYAVLEGHDKSVEPIRIGNVYVAFCQ
jgi:hypothetical protein